MEMSYTAAVLSVEVKADTSMCKSGVKMVVGALLWTVDIFERLNAALVTPDLMIDSIGKLSSVMLTQSHFSFDIYK